MLDSQGAPHYATRVVDSQYWRKCNCRPSAFIADPVTAHCYQSMICPHCWGRSVLDQWRAVDNRLFAAPPPEPPSLRRFKRGIVPAAAPKGVRTAPRLSDLALLRRSFFYRT